MIEPCTTLPAQVSAIYISGGTGAGGMVIYSASGPYITRWSRTDLNKLYVYSREANAEERARHAADAEIHTGDIPVSGHGWHKNATRGQKLRQCHYNNALYTILLELAREHIARLEKELQDNRAWTKELRLARF